MVSALIYITRLGNVPPLLPRLGRPDGVRAAAVNHSRPRLGDRHALNAKTGAPTRKSACLGMV